MKKESTVLSSLDLQEKVTILQHSKHYCLKFFNHCDRTLAQCLSWLLIQIRPLFGPLNVCPFQLGCTEFCIEALRKHIVLIALLKTSFRLLKCNPIYFLILSKSKR